MINYNIIEIINHKDNELKEIINQKLYNIITILEGYNE